jgi:hypothetical protein
VKAHVFQTPPDDLSEAHFVLFCDRLGVAIEIVRKLNLRFNHDGNLPSLHSWSNLFHFNYSARGIDQPRESSLSQNPTFRSNPPCSLSC